MTETEDRKAKAPEAGDLQVASRRALRKFGRGFRNTWKMYRESKTGLAGLAIVLGFFIVAVFAPWLAPYDDDFKAPSVDTFIADYASMNLTAEGNWTKVLGLTSGHRDHPLERVLGYSQEGVALVFPVSEGTSELTGEPGIVVGSPTTVNLPANATYMTQVHYTTSFLFIMNTTEEGAMLYQYSSYIATPSAAPFDLVSTYNLSFTPKYNSNLWNGFSFVVQNARLAIVFADDHNLWMLNKRPGGVFEPGVDAVDFVNRMTIDDATIVGNPLVVDGDFENGSMMLVPTDLGIRAYELNITASVLTGTVTNITIGDMAWSRNYTIGNRTFEPVTGQNMMAFPYPYSPTSASGKEYVVVASTEQEVVAYDRLTGNTTWSNKLLLTGVYDFEITSLHPSPDFIVMVGKSDTMGLVAGIDKATGRVKENNTMYTMVDGYLNSDPEYVSGQLMYVFSTDKGAIYLANSLLKVNATFAAPGGGAVTPVAFLGNIYIEMSRGGNYFGVVTADDKLFVETLTGVAIAPLPPGRYPSGNYYPLGTDWEGQDILTQVMYGTRAELMVGITAAFFSVVIGTIVGLVAGFYSGFVDDLLMRTTDVMLSLPYLVIMLLFAAAFGPSLMNIIIIFAILSWAGIARVIRSVTLSIKERAFVDAAIVSGASDSRLIFTHIGPNVLPFTFLYMTFSISGAIVTEAILAFLGFGDPTNITWGMMLQYLQISGHSLDAPWWLLPPGIAITLLSLAFYLIGRAFDEVVNPRLRKR